MSELFQSLSTTTLRGIDEADETYSEILRSLPRPSQWVRSQIKIERAHLQSEWHKVYENKLLEALELCTITPPNDIDYTRAQKITATLDQMTASSESIGTVVELTTELMTIWKKSDLKKV